MNYNVCLAIIEDKEPLKRFILRRIKKLGLIKVSGQLLFQALIVKILQNKSRTRKAEIIKDNNLDISDIPDEKKKLVKSVNTAETIKLLQSLDPDLIIVNGTRIISQKVLSSVKCPFINTHAGITPKYRGVHGTYWALYNNDAENSGVTVHLVDKGIDTGNIIFQKHVVPGEKDNFSTYPLLQLAEGLKILNEAVMAFMKHELQTQKVKLTESILWYHPTIWQYLYGRIVKGIK